MFTRCQHWHRQTFEVFDHFWYVCGLCIDYMTQEAAKILRLLHIRELRELQTLANEAIIAVQKLTANPKTDTKLGKVGI